MNAPSGISIHAKRILFFCCLYTLASTSRAQSQFNIAPSNSIISAIDCDSTKDLHFYIENPNPGAVTIQWKVKSNSLPSPFDGEKGCWIYQLCDWELCTLKIPDVDEVISRVPLKAKTVNNEMKLTVSPQHNKGGGILVIELFEKDFPSNSKTITWNITGCATGQDCANSISESSIHADFIAYPNPAESFINVELKSEYAKNASVQLYNLMGEKLMELTDLKTNLQKIDVTKLPAGGYFIQYNSGNGSSAKKIFKTQ